MNSLFLPGARESKSGLNKNRKIVQYESTPAPNDIKQSIPDNWYYNEGGAAKVWEDLEREVRMRHMEEEAKNQSPFQKIDESTHKIRQMIDDFEITDQEFLMTLMDMLEEEHLVGTTDQSDVLLEARSRLSQLINDHAESAEAESKMLDSLKMWFHGITKTSQQSMDSDMAELSEANSSFDVTQLANMINHTFEIREMTSEQIQGLHRSVVDSMTRQIREMRKTINDQSDQIQELQAHIENQINRRRRASMKQISDPERALTTAQRKIYEQAGKINSLEIAIGEVKEDNEALRSRRPTEEEKPEENPTETEIQLEKEIQYDQKIRLLTETVNCLKDDINQHTTTIRKQKQNEIVLENRIQALERSKKAVEQSLAYANEKIKVAESVHQKKLEEMQKEKAENAALEAMAQTRVLYERQMQELREQHSQMLTDMTEKLEKKYRTQITNIMAAIEDKNAQKVVTELTNQSGQQVELMKQQYLSQIKELKESNGRKITLITRHYEKKGQALVNDNKKMQDRVKSDVEQQVRNEKMSMDEEAERQMIMIQDKSAGEMLEMRRKYEEKVSELTEKLRKVEKEKDVFKAIVEEAGLQDDIFEEGFIEEEEVEDDVLQRSLMQLKEREIEKNVSLKYLAMLKAQREIFEDQKQWELELVKRDMKADAEEAMSKLRGQLTEILCQMRDKITENPESVTSDDFDQLIISSLECVEKNDDNLEAVREKVPIVPITEVESRIASISSKITDLTGENEFLRMTLGQMNGNRELKRGDNSSENLIRSMRSAVAEQARNMSKIMKEYDEMKIKLADLESKAGQKTLSEASVQVNPEPGIYRTVSEEVFTYYRDPEDYFNSLPSEVILRIRDHSNRQARTRLKKSESAVSDYQDAEVQTAIVMVKQQAPVKRTLRKTNMTSSAQVMPLAPLITVKEEVREPAGSITTIIEEAEPKNPKIETINEETEVEADACATVKTLPVEVATGPSVVESGYPIKPIFSRAHSEVFSFAPTLTISEQPRIVDLPVSLPTIPVVVSTSQEDQWRPRSMTGVVEKPQKMKLDVSRSSFFDVVPAIQCPHCNTDVPFNPDILEVSTTVDPTVECHCCHKPVVIHREKLPPSMINENSELTEMQREKIKEMEQVIQQQVEELITLKQQMRTSPPAERPSSPETKKPPFRVTFELMNSVSQMNVDPVPIGLCLEQGSVIEFPGSPQRYSRNPSAGPTPRSDRGSRHVSGNVSARSFTGGTPNEEFSEEQRIEIASKEAIINHQIQNLLDLKHEIEIQTSNHVTARKNNDWSISDSQEFSIPEATITTIAPPPEKPISLDSKKGRIIQSLTTFDIEGTEKIKNVEKTVLDLAKSDVFSSQETRKIALQIVQSAQDLQCMPDPDPEIVENVVESARHLLLSVNTDALDIEPSNPDNVMMNELGKANQMYRTGLTLLKEKHGLLTAELKDIKALTVDLRSRHDEVVHSLMQVIDKLLKSAKNGDNANSEAWETLQKQTEYLAQAVKERESLQKDIAESDQLLRERELELIELRHQMIKKNDDTEYLTERCSELASTVEQLTLQLSAAESSIAVFQLNTGQQSHDLEELMSQLNQSKKRSNALEEKVDSLEMKKQELENKLVMKDSDIPVEYSIVSPFVVFDTFIPSLPPRGVTLVPGIVDKQKSLAQTEKFRVKVGASSPKIILPSRMSPTRSRSRTGVGSPKPAPTPSPGAGYTELVPMRTEDPNSFVYVKRVEHGQLAIEQENGTVEPKRIANYYEDKPVVGNVVVQKTLNILKKRIQNMENLLQNKSHELIDYRDRTLKMKSQLARALFDLQQRDRAARRSTCDADSLRERLKNACETIARRDEEIKELRRLLRELSQNTESTEIYNMIHKYTTDQDNVATMREFRHRAVANSLMGTYQMTPALRRLVERQMIVAKRMEERRDEIRRKQHDNLVAVLQGMELIRSPVCVSPVKSSPREQHGPLANAQARGSITVTSYGTRVRQALAKTLGSRRPGYSNVKATFDEAIMTMNARKQKLGPELQDGIVGNPVMQK